MRNLFAALWRRFRSNRTRNQIIAVAAILILVFSSCSSSTGDDSPAADDAAGEAAESTDTPEPRNTPTRRPTPRPTATSQPEVKPNVNSANVRSGPGLQYDVVGAAVLDDLLPVIGRNSDGSWYNVRLANGSQGWIAASIVDATNFDTDRSIPIAATIPAPSPPPAAPKPVQPTPTTAPVVQATSTQAPPAVAGPVVIVYVNKKDEFVDIRNQGSAPVDLGGWTLLSEKGNQACGLGGQLGGGETLRIWAMTEDAGQGGYNCGFNTTIWNNSDKDPAVLYDAQGQEVSRY